MKATFLLAISLATTIAQAHAETHSAPLASNPFEIQEVHLKELCKKQRKKPVELDIVPTSGPCTQISCPQDNPCCNYCGSGYWRVKDSLVAATGDVLPECKPDGCGKIKSCQPMKAIGVLDCSDPVSLKFKVKKLR